MRKTLTIILIGIISMGIFSFLKKEKGTEKNNNSVILGMILLKEPNSFDLKGTVNELTKKWHLKVNNKEGDNKTVVFDIEDYHIAIATMDLRIPDNEVEKAAEYNYFWKNGVKETAKHKGHIILSITNAGKNLVKENLIYTKLASAVLNNSSSFGIYIGSRSLVLKKEFYLANTELMSEEELPLYNWIYFGLRKENEKQSIYTFGLTDFGKKEMEIVDSDKSLEELNDAMYNLVHYVISSDVRLNAGETIGFSADQKLQISESKGKFLEGTTLKIEY